MSVGSFTVLSWVRILEFPHNFNFETLDKHLTIRMNIFKAQAVEPNVLVSNPSSAAHCLCGLG